MWLAESCSLAENGPVEVIAEGVDLGAERLSQCTIAKELVRWNFAYR